MATITANRKQRNYEQMLANLARLQARFPKAFPAKGSSHPLSPLKINVDKDIVATLSGSEDELTLSNVQAVLRFWCSRRFYLKAFRKAGHRVDLLGNPSQAISQSEREDAKRRREAIDQQRAMMEPPFTPPLA